MPNLENLRKQAKLYLRWHRDGHYPVAAQIRAVLPRFRDLSDREILQQSFKLADAQELVARQAGFESWQALKTGVQAMTDIKPPYRGTHAERGRAQTCSSPTSRRRARSMPTSSASRSSSPTASRPSTARSGAARRC